jgi:hypothetical protein
LQQSASNGRRRLPKQAVAYTPASGENSQALPSVASVPTLGIRQCVPEDPEWARVDHRLGRWSASNPDPPNTRQRQALRCYDALRLAQQLRNPGSGQFFESDPDHGFGAV